MKLKLYTDGSAQSNQRKTGAGGWAFIAPSPFDGYAYTLHHEEGYQESTTNNRMELEAVWKSLIFAAIYKYNNREITEIEIYSDSGYIVDAFKDDQKRIKQWRKSNWKTSQGHKVKNLEKWIAIIALSNELNVTYIKVPAHSGDIWNDKAHNLAYNKMLELASKIGTMPIQAKDNRGNTFKDNRKYKKQGLVRSKPRRRKK